MESKEFLETSNDMTEDIITEINVIVNQYAAKIGLENAMSCFGTAMAVATGNMLSVFCLGLADPKQRGPYIRQFITLTTEAADKHKQRHLAKQH